MSKVYGVFSYYVNSFENAWFRCQSEDGIRYSATLPAVINLTLKQNSARLMTKAEIRHIIVLHDGLMLMSQFADWERLNVCV
jgi:hypothetical protein